MNLGSNRDPEKEEMRDVLRRCNTFVANFRDVDSGNIAMILLRIKRISKEIDLNKLFTDLKKYE